MSVEIAVLLVKSDKKTKSDKGKGKREKEISEKKGGRQEKRKTIV